MTPPTLTVMDTLADTITLPNCPGLEAEIHWDHHPLDPLSEDYATQLTSLALRDDSRSWSFDEHTSFDVGAILDEYQEAQEAALEEAEEGYNWHLEFVEPTEEFTFADVLCAIDEALEALEDWNPEAVNPWSVVKAWLVEHEGAIESTMVGLALTDHSGYSLHVDVSDGGKGMGGAFYMGMDTAFIGWAYATADAQKVTGAPDEGLREQVVNDAKLWGRYLSGDVYVVHVESTDGIPVEDDYWLGGLYGSEAAEEAARERLEDEQAARVATRTEAAQRLQNHVRNVLAGPALVEAV